MYTLYKFHFLNGISEINQLFDDILIIIHHVTHSSHNSTYVLFILFLFETFPNA